MKDYKNNHEIILNLEENKLAKLLTELDSFCKACSFKGGGCSMNCLAGHKKWLEEKSLNIGRGDFFE